VSLVLHLVLEHLFLKPSLLVLQEGSGFGSVDMLIYYNCNK